MARRIDKGRQAAGAGLLLAAAMGSAAAGSLPSPACLAGGASAVVTDVDVALDLHLDDGRIVRLAGLDIGDAPADTRAMLAAWLSGARASVRPLASGPDRWGRTPALVFASPTADADRPVSVGEALLDAGRALARPDSTLNTCWAEMLQLERAAQQAGSGAWATSPVLDPGNVEKLQDRAGHFALVAGRVTAVRDGRARLYLRFASAEATGMAAAMTLPLVRRLVAAGMDPHGWTGRRLRVRGLLDNRWGWQIDVSSAQQLEIDAP